jgi:hypothetical protein
MLLFLVAPAPVRIQLDLVRQGIQLARRDGSQVRPLPLPFHWEQADLKV